FAVPGVFGQTPEPAVEVDAVSMAPCGAESRALEAQSAQTWKPVGGGIENVANISQISLFDPLESYPQCDFEDDTNPYCEWAQTSEAGGHRTQGSQNMSVQDSGPKLTMFYLEVDKFSQAGQSFRLASRPFCAPGAICVKFAYHMYGLGENTELRFLLGNPAGNSPTSLWHRIGSQSPDWLNTSVNIPAGHQQPMQLILEAIRGTSIAFVVADLHLQHFLTNLQFLPLSLLKPLAPQKTYVSHGTTHCSP
ncbi:hypothetical protein MC885_007409, partial [Smutsia gigantea]